MGTVSKGVITFVDVTKKGVASIHLEAVDPVGAPLTPELVDTLADAIALVSDCGLKRESVLEIATEDAPTFAGNKDRKGVLTCQDPTTGHVHKWELPGVKVANCEVTEGSDGEHIKTATVTTLTTAFSVALGYDPALIGLYSPVIQDR